MKTQFMLQLNGKDTQVDAEIIDKKIWFKLDQQIYSYDLVDLAEGHYKKSKATAKSADKITAPMPGKVTKVFVSVGQSVSKGDALLVMEAMKMEYTLKADIEATVEKVLVAAQDQVALGSLMVQLKEKN